MKNKVLIQLIVPDIEKKYDLFIPINKKIGNIVYLLTKAINELEADTNVKNTCCIYNRETGVKYNPEQLVYDSDIRNGTVLILM